MIIDFKAKDSRPIKTGRNVETGSQIHSAHVGWNFPLFPRGKYIYTGPATPVLTKVSGGGAGGSGGPGTGGKGKGGVKGTTMITGAKRSAAAAGLGPDLAAATGVGADAAASAAPFSVDLDAAAGMSPSL